MPDGLDKPDPVKLWLWTVNASNPLDETPVGSVELKAGKERPDCIILSYAHHTRAEHYTKRAHAEDHYERKV